MESLMVLLIATSIRAVLHYIFYRVAVTIIFTIGKVASWIYGEFIKPNYSSNCTNNHSIMQKSKTVLKSEDNYETPYNNSAA